MAIQTQQSFSGFVASDPQLSRTENGDARLYMKVGKEHYRQEQDGSFTQLETTFHNLVAFKAAAEQGHERLAKGDKVIADGYVREYSYQRDGQNVVPVPDLGDDLDIGLQGEQCGQRPAHHGLVIGQHHLDHRSAPSTRGSSGPTARVLAGVRGS